MKICIISFDFWGYDAHILEELLDRSIEANHIKLGTVGHKNFGEKLKNAFSKLFLRKNLKHEKRQRFVVESLQKLGKQDQVLVLNPDVLDNDTLKVIKRYSDKLITFLYDNLERFPVQDKLSFFDKIFSFDDKDVAEYGFEKLTNYNYLPFVSKEKQSPIVDVLYITSHDKKRLEQLEVLGRRFSDLGIKFQFFVIVIKFFKNLLSRIAYRKSITFTNQIIAHEELPKYYQKTKVVLDLMRENQFGLSFRVFEAMALEKKIITDNEKIKEYDFYNPNNILVLNKDFSNINSSFFEQPYESLPEKLYEKYTIKSWVKKVFNL